MTGAAAAMVCGKAKSETWEAYTLSAVSGAAGRHGMDEKGLGDGADPARE